MLARPVVKTHGLLRSGTNNIQVLIGNKMIKNTCPGKGTISQRIRDKILKRKAQQLVVRGRRQRGKGAMDAALECFRRALSIYSVSNEAYSLMGQVLMPGDDYLAILSSFQDSLRPESYVEIGVATGDSLALAKPGTRSVGIDPMPRINNTIESRAKIYPITTDDFFELYNLFEELGTSRLALAFIDGLHLFEQALKDFINLERYADKDTVILIHDCLPITRRAAARERTTFFWCGDVWKVIPCLKAYRPDLTVHVIPTCPSGLGVITNLDPNSTVLLENFNQIVTEYQGQDLDYEYLDKDEVLNIMPNIVPNDWEQIRQMLSLPLSLNQVDAVCKEKRH